MYVCNSLFIVLQTFVAPCLLQAPENVSLLKEGICSVRKRDKDENVRGGSPEIIPTRLKSLPASSVHPFIVCLGPVTEKTISMIKRITHLGGHTDMQAAKMVRLLFKYFDLTVRCYLALRDDVAHPQKERTSQTD